MSFVRRRSLSPSRPLFSLCLSLSSLPRRSLVYRKRYFPFSLPENSLSLWFAFIYSLKLCSSACHPSQISQRNVIIIATLVAAKPMCYRRFDLSRCSRFQFSIECNFQSFVLVTFQRVCVGAWLCEFVCLRGDEHKTSILRGGWCGHDTMMRDETHNIDER